MFSSAFCFAHRRWRRFWLGLVVAGLSWVSAGATALAGDELSPLDVRNVRVGGELGRRIDITIHKNILAINHEDDFLKYFREKRRKPFSYVGLGKEIDALVRLAYFTQDSKLIALKDKVVRETIQTQLDDGYIGIFANSRLNVWWDIHEMSYVIYALVQDFRYFGHRESLDAARKAGDYMMLHRPSRPLVFHVSTIGFERAFLALYAASGDEKYLRHANYQDSLSDWSAPIGGHTYDFLNLCMAQIDLYELRGDRRLLRQSRRALDFLTQDNGLLVDGTCSWREGWHSNQLGTGNLGETCVTSYLLRLCDSLLRIEGNSLDGDLIERGIYNALFAAQSPDGRELRKYTPLSGERHYYEGEPSSDFKRDTYCCPNNFRRAIADLPAMIYYRAPGTVLVNLYTASSARLQVTDDVRVEIRQETDYPNSGRVLIHVDPQRPAEFALKLRIPRWCSGATIRINGRPIAAPVASGTFQELKRTWQAGDRVELEMPMPIRLVRGRALQQGKVAVMRGPLIFCLDPLSNAAEYPPLGGKSGPHGEELKELNKQLVQVDVALGTPDGRNNAEKHKQLLSEQARLRAKIAGYPSMEKLLGDLRFDLASISGPLPDKTVRPDGLALRIKAWAPGGDLALAPKLTLRLTEFADPGGEMTYFPADGGQTGVPDELYQPRGAQKN